MDRRKLIAMVSVLGAAGCLIGLAGGGSFYALVAAAFLIGGTSNPLYSLIIAHTNDFLDNADMASASGGLIVLNGVGAAGTPILVGYLMQGMGPTVYLTFIALTMALIAVYAVYRMTKRPARASELTGPMAPISMMAGTQVSAEMAQDYVSGLAPDEAERHG
jgi:fucose permease